MNIPSALKYTKEHEWIRVEGDIAFVGITDFAQGELGDIVFLEIETGGESLEIEEIFSSPADFYLRMGIWKGEELMGQVDLNQAAPGVFVLGYWLGEKYTGHGYMTAACCAVMNYARRTWPVKEFWAGVRHANVKSAAVVDRLGFAIYEELPDRKRYRLICD